MSARLPPKVLALVAAGAAATTIAAAFIGEKEGRSLTAYQDAAKVWTICDGYTHGVTPGMTATPEECDALRDSEIGRVLAAIDRMVGVPMSPARRAAVASFCYNVGLGACARSSFVRKLQAGDPSACDEPLRWVYLDGGLTDCRNPASNCRGIVIRREQEAALCRL